VVEAHVARVALLVVGEHDDPAVTRRVEVVGDSRVAVGVVADRADEVDDPLHADSTDVPAGPPTQAFPSPKMTTSTSRDRLAVAMPMRGAEDRRASSGSVYGRALRTCIGKLP
jgi:hypothetical protein